MPNCFALYRKGSKEPEVLQKIDDEMREHFNAPPSPNEWYERWYDTIGLGLALGNDWDKIKTYFPNKVPIIDWLAENFTSNAWAER